MRPSIKLQGIAGATFFNFLVVYVVAVPLYIRNQAGILAVETILSSHSPHSVSAFCFCFLNLCSSCVSRFLVFVLALILVFVLLLVFKILFLPCRLLRHLFVPFRFVSLLAAWCLQVNIVPLCV